MDRRSRAGAWASGVGLVTASLIALWTTLEGERFTPYRDIAGVWTVCSGHTGPDVVPGKTWTKEECDDVTQKDLTKFALVVMRCVQVPLLRNQFEALVVFAGNVGEYAFCNSSMARRLNAGDYKGAESEFQKWVYVRCNVECQRSQGLLNRRMAELARFREAPTVIADSATNQLHQVLQLTTGVPGARPALR